jgi:glutathione synthase/RimK-type ligase-like ATP-grasp enzyme
MNALVVIENTERWRLNVPGVEVVSARTYVGDPTFVRRTGTPVFNLCRTYGYQTMGYYVSLLAMARGHRPLPSVATLQDMRLPSMIRTVSDDLDELIQKTLRPLRGRKFELSIYFGRNLAKRYDRLGRALFNEFPAPLLQATFAREGGDWKLKGMRPIATTDIPENHQGFLVDRAREYLARPRRPSRSQAYRYDLAILYNPLEEDPPSNQRALKRFIRAARDVGLDAELIEPEDFGRIAEFDALFLRETTAVDHHTFRFARRGAAEGLVVIDDPESIVRCTNKVFLAEAFARHGIPRPRTLVVDSGDKDRILTQVGLPCVLKKPDSSFSQGVIKVNTAEELEQTLEAVLEDSQLAIAQEFAPSQYDWRIGLLEGRPLYACKYHMAEGHWQIIDRNGGGRTHYGRVETIPLEAVPGEVLMLAHRCCRLIGDGLYGVDIKPAGDRFMVMEVNDNPTIDAGYEDALVGEKLYLEIMGYFRRRLEARGGSGAAV